MTAPGMLGAAPCFMCKHPFWFDPDRVTSASIDPETGLPPDLGGDPRRARRGLAPPDETGTARPTPNR